MQGATGRPSLFTPEVRGKILSAIRQGNYNYIAAIHAGVSRHTLKLWMARGRKEKEGEYWEFFTEVMKAEREAETKAVAALQEAGKQDPKWLCWWLERKFPERWGRDTYRIKEIEAQMKELEKILVELKAKHGARAVV